MAELRSRIAVAWRLSLALVPMFLLKFGKGKIKHSEDLNSDSLKTGNIQKPKILKVGIQNGCFSWVLES